MSGKPPHEHDEVSCKAAYDLLFDFLEGNLPANTTDAVRDHFKVCPPCLEFMESYRRTPGLARAALEQQVPPEVKERLKSFLRAKRGKA